MAPEQDEARYLLQYKVDGTPQNDYFHLKSGAYSLYETLIKYESSCDKIYWQYRKQEYKDITGVLIDKEHKITDYFTNYR